MTDLPEDELVAEISAFCERVGISRTTFGQMAVNDSALFTELKKGREPRRLTRQRIRDFMADYPIPSSEESEPAGSGN